MVMYEKLNELIKKMDVNKGIIRTEWANSDRNEILLTYHIFYCNKLNILINKKGIAKILK